MNKIYLPTLKSINIKNFSLYPNALDFTFEFIDGVNLIVGGNGIGKTTFISLIKYGLIGLYKKHKDFRRYKENKIVKRIQYSEEYFRNRMDQGFSLNTEAKVTIVFQINDTKFNVTRSLFDIQLESVKVESNGNSYNLQGIITKQHKYEKLTNEEKKDYLQYKYEELISKCSNVYEFDDFIFFINEILVFGENRKTILWDTEIQEVLSSKYFNDPELDNTYKNLKFDAKYFDSQSRHKSEDIRAVNLVLDKIKVKDSKGEKDKNLVNEINNVKSKLDKTLRRLDSIQSERKAVDTLLKVKMNEKTNRIKEQKDLEYKIRFEEKKLYKLLWEKLNPQYHTFQKYIKDNCSCPLCNKEIEPSLYQKILNNEDKCILCNKEIKHANTEIGSIKDLKENIESKLITIQNIEREIYSIESELKSLDEEFNKKKIEITNLQTKLRDIEYELSSQNNGESHDSITIKKMMNEIALFEKEKIEYQEKSRQCMEEANQIAAKMDQTRINITLELSSIFSEFAGNFLAAKCELTYDDLDGEGNRYIPSINDSLRMYQDELSESQCFFIDHSFRMSLLRYFYTTPAFFICETPESSLDISYEVNAANIFLKYIDKPNSLILTSNLNNSEFLDYIVEHAPNISYINLLKIGKPTAIQRMNSSLIEISDRIEEKVNAKRG